MCISTLSIQCLKFLYIILLNNYVISTFKKCLVIYSISKTKYRLINHCRTFYNKDKKIISNNMHWFLCLIQLSD